jgi:xanthine dehydrogenase YagS FAD-binding subunit
MEPFTIKLVADLPAAIQAVGTAAGSKFIAGGTNLVDLMKMYVETPALLVDINGLNLNKIESLPHGGVRIGALVRNSDLAYHPLIQKRYSVLSQALLSGASPQLRNMATTGGNILQRTRCPYFFDISFPCNKRAPGSGCSAIKGYNRSHAVLGGSDHCIATHPSDMCVAMAALDASIRVEGPGGTRVIPFTDFHLLPGDTPEKETVLQPGELITAVDLPELSHSARSHYLKVRDRASYEFALASAAVVLNVENGNIRSARIALGGVGTKPWRAAKAEELLKGRHTAEFLGGPATEQLGTPATELSGAPATEQLGAPRAELLNIVAAAAVEGAKGYAYNEFKIELAKRTLIRALTIAGGKS